MFAPIGFIPISRILGRISRIAEQIIYAEALKRKEIPWREFWKDLQAGRKDLLRSKPLLEAWLMARILTTYDVYAASPEGNILLIDGWAVEHQEQLDWYEWGWPDKYTYDGELNAPMQILREGFNPLTRFTFLDLYTGTVSISRRREWLSAEEARSGDDLSSLALALSKLDGWAICFKSEDLPENTEDLLGCIGADLPHLQIGGSTSVNRRGRPQKVPKIIDAYISEFPDGHGRLQREEVRRRLQPIVKFDFALDTLDKAIRAIRGDGAD